MIVPNHSLQLNHCRVAPMVALRQWSVEFIRYAAITMKALSLTILIIALTLMLSACKKDASVLLAECIVEAHKELLEANQRTIEKSCNVGLKGDYLAVLYPAASLNDEELKNYGLNVREIKKLRSLQLSGTTYESIYMIPLTGQMSPCRTTSQSRIVNIQGFIYKKKSSPVLELTLEWTPNGVKVVGIR